MDSGSHTRPLEELTGLVSLAELNTDPDPAAAYGRLRQRWGEVAPIELEPGVPAWLVMGYYEIFQVVRNERVFSRDSANWKHVEVLKKPGSTLAGMMTPLEHAHYVTGEKHRRLRAPLDDGLAGLDERRVIDSTRKLCLELIEQFADRGEADLVLDYAVVIPMLAVADWFGIGNEDSHRLLDGIAALFSSTENSQWGRKTVQEILAKVVAAHHENPADDLTTAFLRHRNLRDDTELMLSILVMMGAGYEATIGWIAQTLLLMLTDSRFSGRLRGGRLTLDDALDEVLWRRPPAANVIGGYALADCEIGDRLIQKGDAVILSYGAANADPRIQSDDPWLSIGNRAHLAWGAGPHVCPAQRHARVIVRTAVETVLTRLHDVQVTMDTGKIPLNPSFWIVCPSTLPVRFSGFH